MPDLAQWERFKRYLLVCDSVGVTVDVSRMNFSDAFLKEKEPDIRRAFTEMDKLEAGEIANPDEKRMVGHYWLRDSSKAKWSRAAESSWICQNKSPTRTSPARPPPLTTLSA